MSELKTCPNQDINLNDSVMILTIDIGNGICDKLKIHNINKFEQESYNFCAKNNLDFQTMREINYQIEKVISENKIFKKYIESENNQRNNSFQNKEKNNKNKKD